MEDPYIQDRLRMVEEQLRRRDITDEKVLEVMKKVRRHEFVPPSYRSEAYADYPLPIGEGQTISQPYIVAYMTQALDVKPGMKVLEIGTGSGYQAAVLAELGARVYSMEIVASLCQGAQNTLQRLGYKNIHVRCGNGYAGWPEESPFDRIIITAAPPEIPPKLVEQLADGGILIAPVGTYFQELVRLYKKGQKLKKESLLPVRFVPMVDPQGSKR
ncbi:MAG: protein-L-isoaspartate(D-aspartate) O-methyltransferase [Leptospiraceae bacterium]|nr:protein-L-isoaspartate(D-aspartate) O-methyltransferase [Leptospiraceae bacterium]MDW8307539.1 protein-L-isoaspartate(D-aspartate) O-methyltransferase [Leptospiraceae bacterium]